MYALIPAGGIPAADHPLYPYTQGDPRAMIEVGGRPMLQHVLDALDEAETITATIVVGLPESVQQRLTSTKPTYCLPDQGGLVENVFSGLKWLHEEYPAETAVLGCAADVPHLKGYMVDELIDLCRPFDHTLYYTIATPELLNGRYPNAQRTYATFADGVKIAGGDVFVGLIDMLEIDVAVWQSITNGRKHPWRMARLVGWGTLFKFVIGRLSLNEAQARASKLMGKPVKLIYLPYPEMAMDGDKPHQIEILRHTTD